MPAKLQSCKTCTRAVKNHARSRTPTHCTRKAPAGPPYVQSDNVVGCVAVPKTGGTHADHHPPDHRHGHAATGPSTPCTGLATHPAPREWQTHDALATSRQPSDTPPTWPTPTHGADRLTTTIFKRTTMPSISVTALHLIPTLQPTAELIAGKHHLSAEQIADRLETAYHEAAHLVAAASCKGAYIWEVVVSPDTIGNKRTKGRPAGKVSSVERHEHEECLVTLAGYAWEELSGVDLSRNHHDLERGTHAGYPFALAEAQLFVSRHEALIRHTGHAILALCDKNGKLKGIRLTALVKWIRGKIWDKH